MDVAQWGYLDGCYKWMDVLMGCHNSLFESVVHLLTEEPYVPQIRRLPTMCHVNYKMD